jgi:hypothetical protein
MREMADQVWEKSDIDGNYTLVKMRQNHYVQWNPGTVKTETEMEQHIRASKTFPVGTIPNLSYPMTPEEAYTKTGRPVGGPRTLTRSGLRDLLRNVYQQGQMDSILPANIQKGIPTNEELDQLVKKYLKKLE